MLCNTIILASATILTLLLTLLGLSTGSKSKLKNDRHVLQIAKFDTALFISALISFHYSIGQLQNQIMYPTTGLI